MSRRGDDYASANGNPAQTHHAKDTEPADPDACDHGARRALPIAPDTVKLDRLPDPLVEEGKTLTVDEAGEAYLKVQRHNWKSNKWTSAYERHKYQTYPRILEADRHFRNEYEGLTTVMLTRRLSPLDDTRNWLTPWECNEMLHGGKVHRSVRDTLAYQLGNFEFEWLAVTAPTRSAGTPHEHIYLWIDDPDDEVTTDHIGPALDKHLKYCMNAYEKHHRYRPDGTDGAITVQHSPDCIDSIPARICRILEESATYEINGELPNNTRGAQYLASQLAHLPLGDYYDPQQETPSMALYEGAALAWASFRNWFRAGQRVPGLEN
jgi:hypothetical protein